MKLDKTPSRCEKCIYEWESRVENPKACPRCKTRLDWIPQYQNNEATK